MNINNQPVVTERFTEPGCRVTLFRDERNDNPESLALFRGGLGDVRSSSMGNIAHEVLRVCEGEVTVGIVRTTRPHMFRKAMRDSIKARETRAISMESAITGSFERYPSINSLVVAGQSQGGVTAVDGLRRLLNSKNASERLGDIAMGVYTMDTPGVFGPMEYEGSLASGLGRLLGNCVEDIVAMTAKERFRMLRDMTKRGVSPYEAMHIIGEIMYLRDVDISPDIGALRDFDVDVWHSFRTGDVVPGAEVLSDFTRVYEGNHLRSVHGSGSKEVALDIQNLFKYIKRDIPEAA